MKIKKVNKIVVSLLTMFLIIVFVGKMNVFATEQETKVKDTTPAGLTSNNVKEDGSPQIVGYAVTNGTITPGEDFTLTLYIRNFNGNTEARDISVVLTDPEGVIPEYGTISRGVIDVIYQGGTDKISFKYSAIPTLNSSYLNFEVYLGCGENRDSSQVRIPVGRVTDFEVVEVTAPVNYTLNQAEYVSAMIKNAANTDVSNAVLVARCDEVDIASVDIGTMSAGTSSTQSLEVAFQEEGQHNLDLILTYLSGTGEKKEYVINSSKITVTAVGTVSDTTDNTAENLDNNENAQDNQVSNQSGIGTDRIIMICIVGLLLIGVCCIILSQIYKRK